MKRLVLAALLGGLVVFFWGALDHMVLPIGHMGFQALPNEAEVLPLLGSSIPEPGLYFFPGMDLTKTMTPDEEAAWTEKYRTGPAGLVLFHPQGGELMTARSLFAQLASNVAAAAIAALVAGLLMAGYWRRVGIIALLGLFAWLSLSASDWIWFSYPAPVVIAEAIDVIVAWFLGGLVIAKIVPPQGGGIAGRV